MQFVFFRLTIAATLLPVAEGGPDAAVVIDVLRATTTIAWSLANGAEAIQAFADLRELEAAAAAWALGLHLAAAALHRAGVAAARRGHGGAFPVARGHQFGKGALEDDLAAEFSGSGAEVQDVVGGAHDVGVVFDDQDGVAEVAEFVEDADQARRVA